MESSPHSRSHRQQVVKHIYNLLDARLNNRSLWFGGWGQGETGCMLRNEVTSLDGSNKCGSSNDSNAQMWTFYQQPG